MKHSKRFDEEANKRLLHNQHKLDRILHILRRRNGIKCYSEDRQRTEKVIQHYITKCHIRRTTVERFWYLYGTCILIGKAN